MGYKLIQVDDEEISNLVQQFRSCDSADVELAMAIASMIDISKLNLRQLKKLNRRLAPSSLNCKVPNAQFLKDVASVHSIFRKEHRRIRLIQSEAYTVKNAGHRRRDRNPSRGK
jgi:hypothetical protein